MGSQMLGSAYLWTSNRTRRYLFGIWWYKLQTFRVYPPTKILKNLEKIFNKCCFPAKVWTIVVTLCHQKSQNNSYFKPKFGQICIKNCPFLSQGCNEPILLPKKFLGCPGPFWHSAYFCCKASKCDFREISGTYIF